MAAESRCFFSHSLFFSIFLYLALLFSIFYIDKKVEKEYNKDKETEK